MVEELLVEQKQGREPNDPKKLCADAGKIGPKRRLDTFPVHSAWLGGSWKLHRIENPKTDAVRWELYDLAADPKGRDLPAAEPARKSGRLAPMAGIGDAATNGETTRQSENT